MKSRFNDDGIFRMKQKLEALASGKSGASNAAASAVMFAGLAATIGFILACAAPARQYTPLPESHWNENYFYNFDPPQKAKTASVKVNVIVVNPFYKEPESAFIDATYAKVGRGLSKSMGVDLDKIIVAKGMTAIGPYQTLDDVTYPDKKGADITLAPRVFLTTETKFGNVTFREYRGVSHYAKPFTMKIGGWVAYEMREPLSGQKLWVKKLELEEREVRDVEVYEAVAGRRDQYGNVMGWNEGKIVYSGREEALADALKASYPIVMEKAWTFLSTDEIQDLVSKTKEIRERKVY
jgi:hypothetical protein